MEPSGGGNGGHVGNIVTDIEPSGGGGGGDLEPSDVDGGRVYPSGSKGVGDVNSEGGWVSPGVVVGFDSFVG